MERGRSPSTAPEKLKISDLEQLIAAVADPVSGFTVKDRSWRLKSYPKCFVGEEAVQWIRERVEGAASVSDALFVGQMLLDRKVFRHVVDKSKPFLNDFLFYRFIGDADKSKDIAHRTLATGTQEFVNDPQKWEAIVALFRSNIEIKDRKWGLKTYPQCFLGSDAASTIVQVAPQVVGGPISRDVARELLQLMADSYLFVHVTKNQLHVFRDDPKVYFKFADSAVYSARYLKTRLHSKRIGEAKARGEGCRAKRPIFLVPGIYSSVLDVWTSVERPKWQRDRLWVDFGKIGFLAGKDTTTNANLDENERRAKAREFVRHLMPAADGISDPEGIKVRPREGLAGIDYLTEGFFKENSCVYGTMIKNLLDVGYDVTSLHVAPYDWRIAPQALEQRDGYFSRLKANVEYSVIATGERAVLVGHSMGCRVISYFLNFVGDENWIQKHISAAVLLAPPLLGAPFALKAMITGENLNIPLLSAHEGSQICHAMGSWPWLMPLPLTGSLFPEPVARVKITSESKKKKDKEVYVPLDSVDTLEKAKSPGKQFWDNYYVNDKHFFANSATGGPPALELPPVERLHAIYGINVETEISYFFKLNDDNPLFIQAELDSGLDSLNKKESKELNPQGLAIRGGIMYETKKTIQPAFDKRAVSGDGSIPYASMAYAHKLKEISRALQKSGKSAPNVEVLELDGVTHRGVLSSDAAISAIIDVCCK